MTSEQLSRAIGLIRSGHREEARELLQLVVAQDPTIEKAWLWLVETLQDDTQRVAALEMCLKFNPDSQLARRGLNLIMQAHAGPNAPRFISDKPTQAESKYEPTTYDREFASRAVPDESVQEDFMARISPIQPEPDLEELTFRQVDLPTIDSSPPIRVRRKRNANPLPAILAVIILAILTYMIFTNMDRLAAYFRPTAVESIAMKSATLPADQRIPTATAPAAQALTKEPEATIAATPTLLLGDLGKNNLQISSENAADLKLKAQLPLTIKSSSGPYLSPTWKQLAIIGGTEVTLIDLNTGQPSGVLRREGGNLTEFVFSPDGKQAATLYSDRAIFLWDLAGSSAPYILRPEANPSLIAYTPDSKYLAVKNDNKEIQFYELVTHKLSFTIPNTMDINSSTLTYKTLPNNRVLTIERDRVTENIAMHIYDLSSSVSSVDIFGDSTSFSTVEVSPSGKYLATGGNGWTKIYNTANGQELYMIPIRLRPDNKPIIRFSPLESFIILESIDDAQGDYSWPNLYSLNTGEKLAKLDSNITEISSIAISPEESLVAMEGKDADTGLSAVEVFSSNNGQWLVNIQINDTPGWLEFSPDTTLLLSVSPESARYLQVSATE